MLVWEDVRTIRDLIDRQAEARPDCDFLLSSETGRVLTFRQLRGEVRQLCGLFQSLGLVPGDKIAFLMDNGLFTAQLFLATMYGGFVSVPLNVRAGVSQLAYTLEHSDSKLVFVGRPYETLLQEVLGQVRRPIEIVPADVDCGPGISTASLSFELPPPGADDAAMLIYTSGSTGQPKGPIHTHRSILAHGRNPVQAHELTAADRSLLVLPLYHINAEAVTLVPTLLSGGSVVLPHGFTVSEFWNWIDDHRCTWTAVVPTIISQLLDWKDPKADRRAEAFARIRFLRSSSAPLSPSLHREFIDKFKLPLIQAMGSSEAGNVFSNPVPPGVNKIGSPGLPTGFEARIVDSDGADLPAGEPGEVWLRGEGLTRRYYKDPAATAAAFDAEGWLHTGDLAYRDADGYFFVIGRSKELIIKGGVNIAPKQIDEILETHSAVLEAAAVGVPDRYVGEDLVAFAVLRQGMRCDELELLSFCESHLGYFKTPTRVYFVADLPKGPSGKVQRLRLVEEAERLAVASAPPVLDKAGASAVTEAGAEEADDPGFEQIIAEIWGELLPSAQVGPDSNFFALGGQSLQAIQCLSRLRERTQILLSLADFFANATVAELDAVLRRRWVQHQVQVLNGDDQAQEDLQPIPRRDSSLPCPLSPAQERLWFMAQVKAEEPTYNEAEAVRLKGKLDIATLERAFNIIVGRHEILRTTIEAKDGNPTTTLHESFPLRFKKISLAHLEPGLRDGELTRLLSDEPRLPYRLERDPAVRLTIVEMSADDHAVILMMHHIICDRASLGVLWRELAALYDACLKGEDSPLAPLPIQYGDYAVWQRQPRQQQKFDEDIAFWKEKLRDAPSLLDQPTDRPRPPVFSFRGIKRQFSFDAAMADDLRRLCRQHQTSLFTVFAAALNTVMHRYTGQDDILIGIPIAARERPELRPLIGFLVDTHVLRTNLGGDPSFRELMADVQQNVAAVYSHHSVPFDRVVSALQPERNPGYSPLIQVVLNWRDRDDQAQFIGLPGMISEALLAQTKIAKFDLTLTLTDTGHEITLEIEYNTDLFNEYRIERLVGHLASLLQGVVANVEQRLSALPLLGASERDQLLHGWNATQAEFPAEKCVHEMFEAKAAVNPDAIAVVFEDQQLSYAELNRRANRLAHYLRELGVGPDLPVAICVERSFEMIIGLIAILKAGGAYVPLDPTYPVERLKFMLQDAKPIALLAQPHLQQLFPEISSTLPIIFVQETLPWQEKPDTNPEPRDIGLKAQHLAYIIYTSGSTGTPKGVAMPHVGLVNLLNWQAGQSDHSVGRRTAQYAALGFDVAFQEIFSTLCSSGTLVLLSHETKVDPKKVCRFVEEQRIQRLFLPYVALQIFAKELMSLMASREPEFLTGFQLGEVITAGEQLRVDFGISGVFKKLGHCTLQNQYGPSETHVVSSFTLAPNSDHWTLLPPVGRPIANTQIYILDAHGGPAPIGVTGELYIGGVGVARGYLNRPELTAERFLPNPFSADPAARMYRTGDVGRWLADGNIEFLDRNDFQMKLRGFRIELGEIEIRLLEYAAIRGAVVVAREDASSEKRLVAYYVTLNHAAIDPAQLRSHLAAVLPEYMVPAAYVRLEALPLTPNGKLDRRALPAPDDGAYVSAVYEAPQGETEILLATIWSEFLGVERISRNDNFFNLGGHSLLAMRVLSRLQKLMDVSLDINAIFENSTLDQLAKQIILTQLANYKPEDLATLLDRVTEIS